MTNYQPDILRMQAEVLRGVAKALDDLAEALHEQEGVHKAVCPVRTRRNLP